MTTTRKEITLRIVGVLLLILGIVLSVISGLNHSNPNYQDFNNIVGIFIALSFAFGFMSLIWST